MTKEFRMAHQRRSLKTVVTLAFDTWGRQRRGSMPKVGSWLQAVWKISRDGYQGYDWHSPSCCSWGLLLEANDDDDVDLVCEA